MSKYTIKEILKRVPLDYESPQGEQIDLFGRVVFKPENQKAPIFVYLQGGPGYPSPRDVDSYQWTEVILKKYRLLLLDQRGTGRSQKIGPELAEETKSPSLQARYFSFHRADNIIRDLEFLRAQHFRVKKWFLVCQSYGGFVATSYLSFYPDSLAGAILCGGLPPLTAPSVRAVYEHLTENIHQKNLEYYRSYPRDRDRVRRIVDLLREKPLPLGSGGKLTLGRFLDIGLMLGRTGGFKAMHLFLEDPFLDSSKKAISFDFATKVERQLSYETNPIYAVLHESIYCDGWGSHWAADGELKANPIFSHEKQSICFHGETIRKAMFSEYGKLKPFKKCAQIIAEKKDWGPLYDLKQLGQNQVPVEAIVYKTDYYVDCRYSLETRDVIQGCKTWIHPTWQHDSLRTQGEKLMEKLLRRLEKRL